MRKNNGRMFWALYHAGMLVMALTVAAGMRYSQGRDILAPGTILMMSIVFSTSALVGYLAIYIVNKSSHLSHKELNRKIMPLFLLFLLAVFFIANLVVSLGVFAEYLIKGIPLTNFFRQLVSSELGFANKSLLVWVIFFTVSFFYVLWQKSLKKELSLREENMKFRYQALKSQVNPHFLFNSLNTLSELIYTDVKQADTYLQKLADVYRYVLEKEETDLIALHDELTFVGQYFDLQKERDSGKISLEVNIDHIEKLMIIPVSLQLLIENALKHNITSRDKPLLIRITREDDYIVVSNNLQRKNILETTTKKGLSNLAERVKLILDKDLIVDETNNDFKVKLPVNVHEQINNIKNKQKHGK